MDVKLGYKQTEVGVIPEDWDAVPLDKLGKFKNDINKSAEAFGHGFPFVNLMDVFGVSSISSTGSLGLLDTSNLERQTYDLCKGDVVFVRSSVKPSGVGLTAVVEEDLAKTVFSGFLIRFRDNGTLDTGFRRHCFLEEGFRRRLISASSVSANTNISQDSLKRLILPVPPTKTEQQAIAEALSDVDALISALGRLIAKKRAIKQGAMQELLTGRRRLPGFDGEWEIRRLGDIVEKLVNGGTPSTQQPEFWAGHIPWITGADILDQQVSEIRRYITEEAVRNSSTNVVERDNLLLVSRTGVGKLAIAPFAVAISQDFTGVYVRPDRMLPEFLFRFLDYKPEVLRSQNQGTSIQGITRETLISIPVPVPQLAEQTAIATILSDMDAEIAALERRRDKTKLLKQGMMQELLTGRIRLVGTSARTAA